MSTAAAIITISICIVCLIIGSLILWDFIRSIGPYQWERKPLKWLGGICLISFTISLLITTISQIIYASNKSIELFVILYEIKSIFWVIGECFTYFIFIVRIYYTFEGTEFQAKPYIFKILLIAIIIFIISQLQFIFLIGMYYLNVLSDNAFIIARDIQIVFNDLVDLIISITLFYLFMSKLYKIYYKKLSNLNLNNGRISHKTTINGIKQRDQNDTILFNITGKLTVLAFLPLIVTQINFLFECILFIIFGAYGISNDEWLISPIVCYIYLFDIIISMWCSYMTYTIENAILWYSRCCNKCDKKCKTFAKEKYIRRQPKTTESYYFELTDEETIQSPVNTPPYRPQSVDII